nr:MAG TPA: hypothetical protein [Caudoviricetes sp.]
MVSYLVFLVCDNALPATRLLSLLYLLLLRILEATVATLALVCFLFAISNTSYM